MFSLENKTILITGGGSGIGRAMSVLFAKQKGYVVIIDMDEAGAEETLRLITSKGYHASFIKCNVADEEEVQEAISKAITINKRVDVLINNAGIAHIGTVESTAAADIERLLSVNVKGVYHMIKHAVPYMKEHGGVILNMASIAALGGLAGSLRLQPDERRCCRNNIVCGKGLFAVWHSLQQHISGASAYAVRRWVHR